ncbi:MAG: proteasome endopeptidase complex, archaeal, alpha subunit [Nanoarchaeota archaeon]|jgi:proteasome alpha subunit|nr:proteasome endopeptidase complex, archaeal, alpha subunit [Nanoarchaeota archaeon]|tara:strand:+ start:26361 stop:27086 length:726 start_codon:yes stop_codon:yes gene_type:complete
MEQETVNHQMMGYDRTSTMFSPDGRLLQVEYAKKTIRQGSTAIGMVCKEGVLLLTDKRFANRLIVGESVEKLFQIDGHLGATISGFVSDGRILIEKARIRAQQHRVTYDEPIDVLELVRGICDMKQWFTQVGGARPFGVSILFGGVDEDGESKLFATEPSGIFFQYKAVAIGEGEVEVSNILDKEYKDGMSFNEGISLAMRALRKVLGKDFDINRISAAFVGVDDKKYRKIELNELKKIIK